MNVLKTQPKSFRGPVVRGFRGKVVRDGGDRGVGVLRGVSVITRGEASGHDIWIDKEFLRETADAINATDDKGVKSRFGHPTMSGDALGTLLGRVKNARVSGDQTLADLHFTPAAAKAPSKGDLIDYVSTLAETDPEGFGTSIVFMGDEDAEQAGDRKADPKNVDSLPVIRLGELQAVDAVDEPAANPGGMFDVGSDLAAQADAVLAYAFGLSEVKPSAEAFGVDADRIKAHFWRFLEAYGLRIASKTVRIIGSTKDISEIDEVAVIAMADKLKKEFDDASNVSRSTGEIDGDAEEEALSVDPVVPREPNPDVVAAKAVNEKRRNFLTDLHPDQ